AWAKASVWPSGGGEMRVGVLALQGGFAAHAAALAAIGDEPIEIRDGRALATVEGLILPGGDSTTMLKLIDSPRREARVAFAGGPGAGRRGRRAGAGPAGERRGGDVSPRADRRPPAAPGSVRERRQLTATSGRGRRRRGRSAPRARRSPGPRRCPRPWPRRRT